MLSKDEEDEINDLLTAELITDSIAEKERIAKVRWGGRDGKEKSWKTSQEK